MISATRPLVGATIPTVLSLRGLPDGTRLPFGRELALARQVALGSNPVIAWSASPRSAHFSKIPFFDTAQEYFSLRGAGTPELLGKRLSGGLRDFRKTAAYCAQNQPRAYVESSATLLYRLQQEQIWNTDIPWAGLIRSHLLDAAEVIEVMKHIKGQAKAYLKERDASSLTQRAWKTEASLSNLFGSFASTSLVAFLFQASAWSVAIGAAATALQLFTQYRDSFMVERGVATDDVRDQERARHEVASAAVAIDSILQAQRIILTAQRAYSPEWIDVWKKSEQSGELNGNLVPVEL